MRDRTRRPDRGFSLVELLVAVLFTGLLMAGMAKVFQGSISRFVAGSEGIASGRHNRLGLGLLQTDLNAAGMLLENISALPQLSTANPGFYVIPNRPVQDDAGSNVSAAANLPTRTDELYMYMDSPVNQTGTLMDPIVSMDSLPEGNYPTSLSFRIQFPDAAAASQVRAGQFVILTDWLSSKLIDHVDPPDGTSVRVYANLNPQDAVSNCAASTWDKYQHVPGRPVMVLNRGRMVRYRIKAKAIDPGGILVPCLVREELAYNYGASATDPATVFPVGTTDQIVTEDISAFKVYLSGNMGASWAGTGLAATANTFTTGWTQGIFADLQTQLGGVASIQNEPNWFRAVPTLVRVDLTSRTTTRRGEYLADGSTNVTSGYKDRVQSLVILPRHFGLPL